MLRDHLWGRRDRTMLVSCVAEKKARLSGSSTLKFTVVGAFPDRRYTIADQNGGPSLEGTARNKVWVGIWDKQSYLSPSLQAVFPTDLNRLL